MGIKKYFYFRLDYILRKLKILRIAKNKTFSNDCEKISVLGNSAISIGRFSYGFENISIKQWGEGAPLAIGSFCSIATDVSIFLGGNHRTDWVTTFPFGHIYQSELGGDSIKGHPSTKGGVTIGNDVWIGSGVTILSGVSIGDGAVLSANSTIAKNVMPYEIVGGNPARSIKQRFDQDVINLLLKLKWWELPLDSIKEIETILCSPPNKNILIGLIDLYRPSQLYS
ncbi:CatB-related O-acetyltransferase [Polynucleobacter sp. AP-Ainpum-60-G11]|uniref:CatB-related O-acetyltransferase n=1 Tax=Polynucleobacter sp. AP-Ainpum-60-G11 TaxID=2576926 RepID=UPI001BFDFEFB|nr:CatB-related O-acetyltransferase [Polynucleobacter sp. AP-Ainpum-60-G11]QWE26860.1 CatB-related O-acetyltransferase [Polynucleobacter sp. AP-Ainpum-60-G11]